MGAQPVERFKATSGFFAGYTGLVFAVAIVGYVLFNVHTVTGLRLALGMTFFGLVTWVTQLRPRATAYPDHLLLKNSVRDVAIPLTLIDEVTVRQTLNVWVGEKRYVCISIGTPARRGFKSRKSSPASNQTDMAYESLVVTRIRELVETAKKAAGESVTAEARYEYAWPEVTALVVTGVAFVISQFL